MHCSGFGYRSKNIPDPGGRKAGLPAVKYCPRPNSIYRWENKYRMNQKYCWSLKTDRNYFPSWTRVKSLHPYAVPEIIAIPIVSGNIDYLKRMDENGQKKLNWKKNNRSIGGKRCNRSSRTQFTAPLIWQPGHWTHWALCGKNRLYNNRTGIVPVLSKLVNCSGPVQKPLMALLYTYGHRILNFIEKFA